MDRIEDHIIPLVRTGVPGDDPAAATDNHLMDIATDPDLPVAVGDGHGIVIRPVARQRQGADPRALPAAGIERRQRQNHQRFAIAPEALADSLTVAAHDLALPVAALFLQLGIEGVPDRKPGTRHHKVPPGVANHPFYIAFIVALAGAAVAVLEQAMGLQPAERPGPLPRAVRQDARHQALAVVVENRLGNPAEEGKGRIVPVQPSLRRRRRAGRNKAGIAVRKRHDEKMRAMHDAGNDRIRLAKVRLGMTRRVRQRHEHLPQTKVPFANVILHDRLLAREAMFVTKTLEDPLRRVPLLAVNRAILFQNAVDDIRERRQLRALRRLASPISRRFRMQQYLGNRLAIDPELARSFPPAQTLTMTRQSHWSIKIHSVHPPPSIRSILTKAIDGPILVRRRNRTNRPLHWGIIAPPFSRRSRTQSQPAR